MYCTWLKSPLGISGRPFDFKLPPEISPSCSGLSGSSGSSPPLLATNRPRSFDTVKREKVVWLLFLCMMSYPDFVYSALLLLFMCMWVCVWRTYKLKEKKGWKKSFPNPSQPSHFSICLFPSHAADRDQPTCLCRAQPSGEGPQNTTPHLKPHIRHKK